MSKQLKFKLILFLLVFGELVCVAILGISIFSQRYKLNYISKKNVIVPMRKEALQFTTEQEFTHFYEPKPNLVIREHPDWLSYTATSTINSDSLNEIKNYPIEKPKNTFRIIALGDSHTYGAYINTPETWPKQLEKLLNTSCSNYQKYEVINLGVSGYDVSYISHRYEIRGKKYKPDLIIWFESGAGFMRARELMVSYVDKYDKILTSADIELYRSKGEYYPQWVLAVEDIKKDYSTERLMALVETWWHRFFRIREDTPVIISTVIDKDAYATLKQWSKGQQNVSIAQISDISSRNGILEDTHPNAKGHGIIAKDTLTHMINSLIIPCY